MPELITTTHGSPAGSTACHELGGDLCSLCCKLYFFWFWRPPLLKCCNLAGKRMGRYFSWDRSGLPACNSHLVPWQDWFLVQLQITSCSPSCPESNSTIKRVPRPLLPPSVTADTSIMRRASLANQLSISVISLMASVNIIFITGNTCRKLTVGSLSHVQMKAMACTAHSATCPNQAWLLHATSASCNKSRSLALPYTPDSSRTQTFQECILETSGTSMGEQ